MPSASQTNKHFNIYNFCMGIIIRVILSVIFYFLPYDWSHVTNNNIIIIYLFRPLAVHFVRYSKVYSIVSKTNNSIIAIR